MTTVVLALVSAVVFGAGDFLGGAASRRAPVLSVLLVSLPVGILILLPFAVGMNEPWTGPALAWGAASGIAGGVGLLVFYGALARGPMSVVAPVSGLLAAAVPAVVGVLGGERLPAAAVAGLLLCLVAICFVSMEKSTAAAARGSVLTSGPVLAAVAGLSFGVFFVLLREGGGESALWPLVASKVAGLGLVVLVAVVRRGSLPNGRITLGIAAGAGALDMTGNALYLLAAQSGMLSVAGVLSSLYPASTVILARLVYGERLRPIQQVGMAVAVVGVVLVGAG